MERSGQLKIYKTTGAAQFSLLDLRRDENGRVSKEGAVLVEACRCSGKDRNGNIITDWENKISFAIGMADICNLMDEDPNKGRLFHNYKGSSKSLKFVPGQGKYEGTFMMNLNAGGRDGQNISVPLTNGEYAMIMTLLVRVAAPKIIGWD